MPDTQGAQPIGRRVRAYLLEGEAFAAILSGDAIRSENPIPEGATVVGAFANEATQQIAVMVQDESFEPVVKGQDVPVERVYFAAVLPTSSTSSPD